MGRSTDALLPRPATKETLQPGPPGGTKEVLVRAALAFRRRSSCLRRRSGQCRPFLVVLLGDSPTSPGDRSRGCEWPPDPARCRSLVVIAYGRRTVGKTVVGTRVVATSDGSLPGVRRATVRWAVVVGPTFLTLGMQGGRGLLVDAILGNLWMIVVYVGVLNHPLRQGLHDRAAGRNVVEDLA